MTDESSIPVLSRDHPGAALKGQMLIKVAPEMGIAAFDYIKTKEKVNILKGLKAFTGYLHTDGNVSYEAMEKEEGVSFLNCLVHARRKFDAAKDYDKERSSYVLEQIQRIYLLERQMRDEKTACLLDRIMEHAWLPFTTLCSRCASSMDLILANGSPMY